jgi:fumarate reductase subunit C
MSTFTDLSVSIGILGVRQGLLFVFGAAAVHAIWFSLLVGLAIETIESGGATRWGAIRGLRAFPVVFALHVIGVAVVFATAAARRPFPRAARWAFRSTPTC